MKAFFRRVRRQMKRYLMSITEGAVSVRLARFQACCFAQRQNAMVVGIDRVGNDCLVRLRGEGFAFSVYVRTASGRKVFSIGQMVRLKYRPEADTAMILFWGKNKYLTRPESYLTLAV